MRTLWIAATLLVTAAWAPNQASAQENERVLVQGTLEDRTGAFVQNVTAPMSYADQLPRWDRTICPGMVGMTSTLARAVIDRIAETARRVGLTVGEPGCEADILMVFTNDVDGAVDAAAAHQRRALGVNGDLGGSRGRAAWRDFSETPRPVRWWHVSQLRTADGAPVTYQDGLQTTPLYSGGLTRSTTRLDFQFVFIIIEAREVSGTQLAPLADYLAMVALAQVNPATDFSGMPTILNLFSTSGAARPTELTAWDIAYLQGLYSSPADARSISVQQREIAQRMARDLASAQ